jgi:hypothetical protein
VGSVDAGNEIFEKLFPQFPNDFQGNDEIKHCTDLISTCYSPAFLTGIGFEILC